MIDVGGVLGIALLGLWVYCIFDVITTDDAEVRNLPKGLWLILVIILFDIGSLAWLVLGRPSRASYRLPDNGYVGRSRRDIASHRPAPELDTGIVAERERLARIRVQEEQLRRREEEIRRREMELDLPKPDDGGSAS